MWAMGCSASNAGAELADRAARQNQLREELIRKQLGGEGDVDSTAIDAQLRQARGVLKTYRHDDSPDAARFGAPAPMMIKGEAYQTTQVYRDSDGRIVREGVRFNGPQMVTARVREEVDGGPYTRVVAEVRGG
jgi:hypothetical protein